MIIFYKAIYALWYIYESSVLNFKKNLIYNFKLKKSDFVTRVRHSQRNQI